MVERHPLLHLTGEHTHTKKHKEEKKKNAELWKQKGIRREEEGRCET